MQRRWLVDTQKIRENDLTLNGDTKKRKKHPSTCVPSNVYLTENVFNVIKLFLEEIEISQKLRNWKKFCLMSETAQKCENNAILKQNFTLKLFFASKLLIQLRGNLDFLLKKFYNISYWLMKNSISSQNV